MLLSRGVRVYWKKFFIALAIIFYIFTMPYWLEAFFKQTDSIESHVNLFYPRPIPKIKKPESKPETDNEESYLFNYKGKTFYVTDVLTEKGMPSLSERLRTPPITSTKRILSESAFQAENLGGCPEWNCEVTKDPSNADAFIGSTPLNQNFSGYFLFSTQESPVNFGVAEYKNYKYNMSIGFRHDSPVASPYGYTVKLAKKSWNTFDEVVNKTLINGKTKGASWFVSHCVTNSKREELVNKLKKYINIDIYGVCGDKQCPKGNSCENKINTDYHFYLALENSVCKDYVTEKVWNQGYGFTAIPIVLSRKLIESYVPPKSFIAFDDYKSTKEMGEHLTQLMNNKTEYMSYFKWRENHQVIFLDGVRHDQLEKPWGLCQLCRLLHLNPLPKYSIDKLDKYWKDTCEQDGELASKFKD